jgi:hypothetical protein
MPAYSGYTAFHLPHPHSHENIYPQPYHPDPGDRPAGPPPGHSIPITIVDLSTRLAVLERDYQNSQAENSKQEAVIQYLLHSVVGQGPSEKKATELGDQVSSLKERNSELTKDAEQLRSQLQQALDIIFTLSTPIAAGFAVQPAQNNDRDCGKGSKIATVDLVGKNDLIDLLECVEGSSDVKLDGEETTLLEDDYNDVSDDGVEIGKIAGDQSMSQSFSSDLTDESSYIHRFVRNKSNVELHDDVKRASMVPLFATNIATGADFGCIRMLTTSYSPPGSGQVPLGDVLFLQLLQIGMPLLRKIRRCPMAPPQRPLSVSFPVGVSVTFIVPLYSVVCPLPSRCRGSSIVFAEGW